MEDIDVRLLPGRYSRHLFQLQHVYFLLLFLSTLLGSVPLSFSTSLRFSEKNETLVSPGKLFEMGLFRSPTAFPEKYRWYLGIWYKKFPSKPVWVANRDDPLSNPSGIVNISNTSLVLLNGNALVWKANFKNIINNDSLVVAELLDNGNFVVKDQTRVLWQSFDSPTDTLLHGMVQTNITSWASSEDPSSGSYRYRITNQQEGFVLMDDRVFITRVFPRKLVHSTITNTTSPTMLRIDETGVLQLLVWREKWDVDWASQVDECDRYDVCGSNMLCDINLNSDCNCVQGYQPDDDLDGCVRKTQFSCVEKEFSKMTNMKLPDTLTARQMVTKMGFEECKDWCLKDCECTAFANIDMGNGGSDCIIWLGELYDIRSYKTEGQDLYVKIPVPADFVEGNNMSATTIGLIVGGSTLLLIFILFLLYKTRKMIARRIVSQLQNPTTEISTTHEDWQSQQMDFQVISQATNFFSDSNKIGEGGFGSVYKGRLLNGIEIAVKRLISMTPNGIENFDNEVRLIGLVQHINIIRLIGFFSDEKEKILVYEHLENLGLDSYIFDTTRSSSLNWRKRFDIIIGIARGLLYLHQDSRFKIIHLDLKPSNVLLGQDMVPKISDFGMAKTLARDETEAIATIVAGTFGYMPPEYVSDKIYSVKSDVFSFGVMRRWLRVLLLEILSGKRNNRFPALNDGESLLSYIWSNWSQGNGLEIVDPAITDSSEFQPDQVLRCIQIGLLCVQRLAQDRPTMWLVVFMLGSDTTTIDLPKSPVDTSSSSREHLDDESYTVCQMSMSAMNGR